jgi:hypothetical protein
VTRPISYHVTQPDETPPLHAHTQYAETHKLIYFQSRDNIVPTLDTRRLHSSDSPQRIPPCIREEFHLSCIHVRHQVYVCYKVGISSTTSVLIIHRGARCWIPSHAHAHSHSHRSPPVVSLAIISIDMNRRLLIVRLDSFLCRYQD